MAHTSKTYYGCYLVFMFYAIFYMPRSVWCGTNRLFVKIGGSPYDILAMPMLRGFIFDRFRVTAADFCHFFSKNSNKSLNSWRKIKTKMCGTVTWGKKEYNLMKIMRNIAVHALNSTKNLQSFMISGRKRIKL